MRMYVWCMYDDKNKINKYINIKGKKKMRKNNKIWMQILIEDKANAKKKTIYLDAK